MPSSSDSGLSTMKAAITREIKRVDGRRFCGDWQLDEILNEHFDANRNKIKLAFVVLTEVDANWLLQSAACRQGFAMNFAIAEAEECNSKSYSGGYCS